MQPQVRETATGYEVSFHEEDGMPPYLVLKADYVERTAWGLLTTLSVQSPLAHQSPLPDGTIMVTRTNLMSARDRRDVAMRLDQKLEAPKSRRKQDWEAHMEVLAGSVNYEASKPVPHMDLREMPLPNRQRFLIPGLLAKGKTNVIFGPGGTGKSVLATRIAASVISGVRFLDIDVDETGEVLYLDWEDDSDTMVKRLEEVCDGMGLHRVPFKYKRLAGRGSYERHHAEVKFYLEQNPTALVIFDSVAMAMSGGSGGDGAEGAIRFFGLLDQLPTTRLLIDHVASDDVKEDDKKKGPPKKPYGSVFKTNSARNMWAVTPWNDQYMSGITMTHTKTNVSRKHPPIDVEVEWRDDYVRFIRTS